MKHDPKVFLDHILESIELIEKYTRNVTVEEFTESVDVQDKVIRRLEIIGEAVKNLPADIKKQHKDVPWKRIAGMRDKLIHEYFGVDLKLTWQVVEKELSPLKQRMLEMRDEFEEDTGKAQA
jgi:uncharacterized protein with HEPN domain